MLSRFYCTSAASLHGLRDCLVGATIQRAFQLLQRNLELASISEPRTSAEFIIAHVLGLQTLHNADRHKTVSESTANQITSLVASRLKHVPIQYVIGEWQFRNVTLSMRPPVFIPRPETEELVEVACNDPVVQNSTMFLEVGCGSGAICISLLKQLPSAHCIAIDQSIEACKLTQYNAGKENVANRLTVLHHIFTAKSVLPADFSRHKFDFLISNPPYVPHCDMAKLQPEIARYEDPAALDGGDLGLQIIQTVLLAAPSLLKHSGSVWLEVDVTHPLLIRQLVDSGKLPNLRYLATHIDFTKSPRFCQLQTSS